MKFDLLTHNLQNVKTFFSILKNGVLAQYQVSRFHDESKEIRDIVRPLVQHLVGVLFVPEVDDAV